MAGGIIFMPIPDKPAIMRKSLNIIFVAALLAFISCNDDNKTANNISKENTMDTMQTVQSSGRIKGPAGALYINNKDNNVKEGIPVLFLHSFGGSSEHWKQQLDHIRQHRPAAAFDFRGHGRSDSAEDSNYFVEYLVKDVEAVIDELGWDQVILVGHSMGGSTAIAYADAHPNKVAGLMMVGTPGKTDPQQSKQIIASLESDQYQHVMDDYMKKILTGAKRPTDELVMQGVQELSRPVTLQIIKGQFAYDPLPALNRYMGPKLIIYSDGESNQPNALYLQAKNVPSKHIDETSHWIHIDKAEEFNAIMDEFLAKAAKQPDTKVRK
jgi:pimeloyl-ACP methyl ester carboxylesterase